METIYCIFWDFLLFYQIFPAPRVKRCAIITYKHGKWVPERLNSLTNSQTTKKLGNVRRVRKPHRMIAKFPAPRQIEYFVNASKKTLEKQKLVSIILWLAVAMIRWLNADNSLKELIIPSNILGSFTNSDRSFTWAYKLKASNSSSQISATNWHKVILIKLF